ncbi:hypothetical protein, partial [Lentibacillus kapialis]|uniref:hypothetical protein n=1 Tax=Lentibacillus kapialis TaxID=340214 RepID=UPI001E49DE86
TWTAQQRGAQKHTVLGIVIFSNFILSYLIRKTRHSPRLIANAMFVSYKVIHNLYFLTLLENLAYRQALMVKALVALMQ